MSKLAPEVERQKKEAAVTLSDFQWAPSAGALYFEGTAEGVRNLWKVSVEAESLRWISGPERLTTDAGSDAAIALSRDGNKVAFTARAERTRIWSIPFNPATGHVMGTAQPITPASMDAFCPDLSRDGKKLVFIARRGGKEELWENSLADNRERLLVAADEFARFPPRWSPDGLRLAYRRARPANPERTHFEHAIVVLPVGAGDELTLTSPSRNRDAVTDWTADGAWIPGGSERIPGRQQLCLFPLAAAPHAETRMRVGTSHPEYNFRQGRFSPDARWISFVAIKAADVGKSTIMLYPRRGVNGGPSPTPKTGLINPDGRLMVR